MGGDDFRKRLLFALALLTLPGQAMALSVKDFGAKCDSVTDDTAAFRAAMTAALGPRAGSNGGALIEIPAGRCLISAPIAGVMRPNSAITMAGQGIYASEIVQTGAADGLVFSFPCGGSAQARTAALPGQGLYLRDFSVVQANRRFQTVGRGVALVGPKPASCQVSSVPIAIDKVGFRSQLGNGTAIAAQAGYSTAQNWASDISIQDVQNVDVSNGQILHYDYGRGSEKDIDILSTSANRRSANATSSITVSNETITGGVYGVLIEGNNIQQVDVLDSPITATRHGVFWSAPGIGFGFNGPVVIRNDSMGVDIDGINMTNVASITADHNEIIGNTAQPGSFFCGICVAGTLASVFDSNAIINLPNKAALGASHYGIGMRINAAQRQYPNIVSNNLIGPTDYGLILDGPIAASNNMMALNAAVLENCYLDQTGASSPVHPTVMQNVCGARRLDYSPNGPVTVNATVLDNSIVLASRLSNGFIANVPANSGGIILGCRGTLASGAVALPVHPAGKQSFHIASECTVIKLTLAAASISGAPLGITPSTPLTFIYDATNLLWTRF